MIKGVFSESGYSSHRSILLGRVDDLDPQTAALLGWQTCSGQARGLVSH
jgi:hypothetical protein